MAKIKDIKPSQAVKCFVKTKELLIHLECNELNEIVRINVEYNGNRKEFIVKDFDILAAWKQMETWLNKQK